jgi:Nucleoside-diphosphate-sugar epimerases
MEGNRLRYLITGGSGYLGTRLVARLAKRPESERVTVADLRPPPAFASNVAYEELDVRDRERARRLVEHERPDALVHLAFVLNPIHDEHRMYEIDVGGTQNILEAASAAGTGRVLVTSSTTAYGAFSDNPVRWPRTIRCAACPTSSTPATRPSPTASASSGAVSTPIAR